MNNIKKKLFGGVRRLDATNNHPVPVEKLREPLPDADYALRFFCYGCGTVLPVLANAVVTIVKENPHKNSFIAVDRCNVCNDEFVNARLENIPTT